jgi:predicted DsbA family dithiol-disulfide isomerase
MARTMTIDFVSDVSCPWCIIGLRALEEALARTADTVAAEIRFQPFELNPAMPPEGHNIVEHITQKYGSTPAQSAANRQMIRDRAATLGFTMAMSDQSRIYNTFDAHRLLHWAELEGHQSALKHALFEAYFTAGESPAEVRAAEELWRARGINAVPAVVIDGRYLISGGQPPDVFEQALRQIATQAA